MEFWTRLQSVLCFSILTLFHIVVGSFTKYRVDKVYSDKLCSDLTNFEVLLASLLECLSTCSKITECRAAIYHKGSRTCYRLSDGYQHQTCSMDLVGARLYKKARVLSKGHCPCDWTFRYKSCYRLTGQANTDKKESEVICKGFSDNAHLVDIQSEEEYDFFRNWTGWYPADLSAFWTDATHNHNNGWTWGDGTPLESWHDADTPGKNTDVTCLYYFLIPTGFFSAMGCGVRLRDAQGLCELDVF